MTASLRQGWGRGTATLAVPPEALTALARDLFGAGLEGTALLSGGLANTNLRLDLDRVPHRVVLRLAQRDPAAMEREAALLRRLQGVVPVAPLLHAEPAPDRLSAPFLVLGFVEGVMLEDALDGADDATTAALGRATGAALAGVHAVTFDRTGFLDAGLEVATPLDMGGEGLVAFATSQTALPQVAERLGARRIAALHACLDARAAALDAWGGPPCLVHADANGSNIMVRRRGADWTVAALLDWEFAFAGTPFFDLGNASRPPAGDRPAWIAGIAAGYRAAGGRLPADWPALARLADLTAWLDFAARPEATEALVADVNRMIDRMIGR